MGNNVIRFFPNSTFTIESARHLLPSILNITSKHHDIIKQLLIKLEAKDSNKVLLENEINRQVITWQNKMKKLGVEGKGLWMVDFDCGNGYYCWKYPETALDHFHSYTEGFQARKRIS